MREFTIGKNDAGQRLDRFVAKNLPLLPPALLQKYIRLKRIKVNGKGSKRDVRLETGDILQLYINDEFFDKPNEENLFLTVFKPQLNIVYEDENLLLVDKRPGMSVHADETEKVNTLINHIQAYLYQKREWNPKWENAFAPALCNRIDRNTGGIVIAAKNAETLRIINEKIRAHELEKSYLCITVGRPKQPEGKIEGFLLKNEVKKEVRFFHKPVPGGKTAVRAARHPDRDRVAVRIVGRVGSAAAALGNQIPVIPRLVKGKARKIHGAAVFYGQGTLHRRGGRVQRRQLHRIDGVRRRAVGADTDGDRRARPRSRHGQRAEQRQQQGRCGQPAPQGRFAKGHCISSPSFRGQSRPSTTTRPFVSLPAQVESATSRSCAVTPMSRCCTACAAA